MINPRDWNILKTIAQLAREHSLSFPKGATMQRDGKPLIKLDSGAVIERGEAPELLLWCELYPAKGLDGAIVALHGRGYLQRKAYQWSFGCGMKYKALNGTAWTFDRDKNWIVVYRAGKKIHNVNPLMESYVLTVSGWNAAGDADAHDMTYAQILDYIETVGVKDDAGGYTLPDHFDTSCLMHDLRPFRDQRRAGDHVSTEFKPEPGAPQYHAMVCVKNAKRTRTNELHLSPESMRHLRIAVKLTSGDAPGEDQGDGTMNHGASDAHAIASSNEHQAPASIAGSVADVSSIAICDLQLRILLALSAQSEILVTTYDLEGRAELPSRKTIGVLLNGLIKLGLARRPRGPHKGATITPLGTKLLEDNAPQGYAKITP